MPVLTAQRVRSSPPRPRRGPIPCYVIGMATRPTQHDEPRESTDLETRAAADRRRAERLSCATVLKLIVPEQIDENAPVWLRTISVKSQDASLGGVRFISPEPLGTGHVYVQSERVEMEVAEIKIVRALEREDGTWDCGAELVRFVPIMDIIFAYGGSGGA